ncbi:MAG: GHMP kinase [Planctomycetes bacterium]|nr:GHMP kinase [Planctomycetota bacterium]
MITVRTPFRISFIGGGSDLSSYYQKNSGAVISTTINKFMYLIIHPYFHNKIRVKYSVTEDVTSISQIQHPLLRECLKLMKVDKGIEIASIADVPAGTGLGSSSAFTVGLLCALAGFKKNVKSKEWLAKMACKVEIEKVKEPIGKQDQYSVSYGGLNYIRFNPDGSVCVEPIILKPEIKSELENNLLMFYVGNERKASEILTKQKKAMENQKKYAVVSRMVKLAEKMKKVLIGGDLEKFGQLLHQGWVLKKKLTNDISSSQLDTYYQKALDAGADGGKILGAGGGGFFLFYCKPKYHKRLRKTLKLRELDFKFDNDGVKTVYYDE